MQEQKKLSGMDSQFEALYVNFLHWTNYLKLLYTQFYCGYNLYIWFITENTENYNKHKNTIIRKKNIPKVNQIYTTVLSQHKTYCLCDS